MKSFPSETTSPLPALYALKPFAASPDLPHHHLTLAGVDLGIYFVFRDKLSHMYTRTITFNHLSIWEQANVIADTRAKALEEWILDGRPTVIPSRHSWGISIRDGPTLASKVSNHLIHFVRGVPLKHFWIHRLKTENINPNMIHWEVFAKSMQYASDPTRLFRTKHMAHITPTGVNLKRRGHREDALCPYCGEIKDNIHIFACAHEEVCTLHYRKTATYLPA